MKVMLKMGLKKNPSFWRISPYDPHILSFGIIFLGLIGGWVISGQMIQLEEPYEFAENNEWSNKFYIPKIQKATIYLSASSPGAINVLISHYYEEKDIVLVLSARIEPGHLWSNRDPPDPLSSPPFFRKTPMYRVSIHLSPSSNISEILPYKGHIVVLGNDRDLIGVLQHDFVLWIIYIFSFLVITVLLRFLVRFSIRRQWISELRKENRIDLRLIPILLFINGVYMLLFFYRPFFYIPFFDKVTYLPIAFSFIIAGLVSYLTLMGNV